MGKYSPLQMSEREKYKYDDLDSRAMNAWEADILKDNRTSLKTAANLLTELDGLF